MNLQKKLYESANFMANVCILRHQGQDDFLMLPLPNLISLTENTTT